MNFIGTATYDPGDDKLRLYPFSRLDKELYEKVRAHGFIWAAKQELFVAPMWTPSREDLLIELCGEVEDEDKTLAERAEERAERFEEYGDKRETEAERAYEAVGAIGERFAAGQPILIGHHSEKSARRDKEKMENGMRRAVKLWETSKYWTDRAAGAIANAKYKEIPSVRARRIKGIEADKRKQERAKEEAEKFLRLYSKEGLTREECVEISNYSHLHVCRSDNSSWSAWDVLRPDGERYAACPSWTVEMVQECAKRVYPASIARYERWINHYENRLSYERAMLAEGGGLVADKFDFAIGGQVKRRGSWHIITKINRVGGVVNSVSVLGHFASTVTVDEISDYRAPKEGDAEKVAAVTEKGPICNYPGEGIHGITQEQWDSVYKDYKGTQVRKGTEEYGTHRVRTVANFKVRQFDAVCKDQWGYSFVWITDAKQKAAPKPKLVGKVSLPEVEKETYVARQREETDAKDQKFEALKDAVKSGVQVVVADQLYPTPEWIAERVIEYAEIGEGMSVLEPSAGTGRLAKSARDSGGKVECVEINQKLADMLQSNDFAVVCGDFLSEPVPSVGNLTEAGATRIIDERFDRVVMNPPFSGGDDVRHILHALKFLKPGGRLVGICANGPKQNEKLKPLATHWIELPEGSFKECGTMVRTAIVVIDI